MKFYYSIIIAAFIFTLPPARAQDAEKMASAEAAALANARQPLGSIISWKAKSARYTRSLPGVPDGEYVVIQYEARFEHKDSAIETITPLPEKDGSWKVSGYFIR
jgi:Protein of unknown function (DUF4019)